MLPDADSISEMDVAGNISQVYDSGLLLVENYDTFYSGLAKLATSQ